MPQELAHALVAALPPEVFQAWVRRVGEREMEYAYGATLGFRQSPFSSDTSSTEWVCYASNALTRGYLGLFRLSNGVAQVVAHSDTLEGVVTPIVRFLSGAKFGIGETVISVAGFKGNGMYLCEEILGWDGKRLELLTPSFYPFSARRSLLNGENVQYEDVDADSVWELVVYPGSREVREGTKSASVPDAVFKFSAKSHRFEQIALPPGWKKK